MQKTSRFRLCIFDWNGTLQNDVRHIYECGVKRIFRCYHLPCPSIEEYMSEVTSDFMKFYYSRGIPQCVTAADLNAIMSEGFSERGGQPELFPDALESIVATRALGCETALVSGYERKNLLEAVLRNGLSSFFSSIVGDVRGKAAEFSRIMAAAGVSGEATAVVGDTVEDALAATEVGATPFICPRGFHSRPRIEAAARDVPNLVIIDTLKDLLKHF